MIATRGDALLSLPLLSSHTLPKQMYQETPLLQFPLAASLAVIPSILVLVVASIPVFLPAGGDCSTPSSSGGAIDYNIYNNDGAPRYQG